MALLDWGVRERGKVKASEGGEKGERRVRKTGGYVITSEKTQKRNGIYPRKMESTGLGKRRGKEVKNK